MRSARQATNALAAVKKLQADTKRLSRNVEQLKGKGRYGYGVTRRHW